MIRSHPRGGQADELARELVQDLGLPPGLVRSGLRAARAFGLAREARSILEDLDAHERAETLTSWLAAWSAAERGDPSLFRDYRALRRPTADD